MTTAISFNLDNFPKLHRSRFQTNHTILFTHERTAQGCDSCKVDLAPVDNLPNHSEHRGDLGWWIEVFTAHPACIYYFGVFENPDHAEAALPSFIDDLLNEGARGLVARIDFHAPVELTVDMTAGETPLNLRTHFPPGVYLL